MYTPQESPWHSLDLSAQLGYPLILEIQGWYGPSPFAWRSVSEGAIIAESRFLESPGLPLEFLLAQDDAIDQNVPPELVSLADNAPFLRYALYQACACLPAAQQLAEDCPLLLSLTLEWAQRVNIEQAELAAWLAGKRARLLETIGLPGSASLARLLRRIPLTPLTSWQLDAVRQCLQQPDALALLRHLDRPSLNHLWFLNRFPAAWPKLLEMIEPDTPLHQIVWLQRMVVDIQRLAPNGTQLHRASDPQALQQLHDDEVRRFNALNRGNRAAALALQYGDYPEAPIPGNADIVALESWDALLAEGKRMHHCIGSYAAQVAARQVFVYHMQAPEALTIALAPQGGQWGLQEARGYCNASPSEASLAAIQKWLAAR
ncbi:PcfJ family protein [Halomonas sp. MCCC 1A11036]|uniref:PcfJ family protein n=1 Tax=Billgrantia zhangzhouensis TaxID=2733481 RepID=A0ABS9AAE2_9GAMM|nr:PcfJ domain-containing protein [Halomonas zhangzhouensis]MCE8018704.1 PcfJ family protein [Halomonas zhangzhouensis]